MPFTFKAIVPHKFREETFATELNRAARLVEDGIVKDYNLGTKDWNTEVKFTHETTIDSRGVNIIVETDNEIYGYVHSGTRPHDIMPRNATRLRFQNTYSAKTMPGIIQSRRGGPSGDVVFSGGVRHPGFQGRFFTRLIKAKWTPAFQRQMDRAFQDAVKKSGHSI
jgi:hypothetical protein